MSAFTVMGMAMLAAVASATVISIAPGTSLQDCLEVVQPGDTCYLEKGDHEYDGITLTHGTEDARITITGDSGACLKGSNTRDRLLQIAHDYYTVEGICIDGSHGDENIATGLYVLGADKKSTKNGVTSSVTGFQMFNLEIKNFAEECVHFRYFVTHAEVTGCTIQHCGIDAFVKGKGSKVGEGLYIGTALDQTNDGKAPESRLRTGSADNVDFDVCSYNWVHHNTFRTYGNECVEFKEGSTNNLVEHNVCEQQMDDKSGCFGARGSGNTFRWNEIAECKGVGFRVGGGDGFGEDNNFYGNTIKNADVAAFSVQAPSQGTVCENEISGVPRLALGVEVDQAQFTEAVATGECSSYPGDIGHGSSAPEDKDEEIDDPLLDDGGLEAGVNFTEEAKESEPEIEVIETNESAGSTGLGSCGTVVEVKLTSTAHPEYADSTTEIGNLFDGSAETYFSVHRESTSFILELKEETEVNGIAIGFFMKTASEERIQVFDIAVMEEDGDDWRTVISRKESSGVMGDVQTFPFSSRKALYVRVETHGNSFNNWSAFTEFEVCGESVEEENALFGGIRAFGEELEILAGQVCAAPTKLTPKGAKATGVDNVKVLFDGDYQTRWSTVNTQSESDLSNDKVELTFEGDMRVSSLSIAFFDGDLAHQYFSVYVQSAMDNTWTPVMINEQAAMEVTMQTFDIDLDGVYKLYIVGKGNAIGFYSKFSEIEVYGC